MPEEELDLKDLTNYVKKWRQVPANQGRDLIFAGVNPVTGSVERVRFINFYGLDKLVVRWARYFHDEPRFPTTAVREPVCVRVYVRVCRTRLLLPTEVLSSRCC